MGLKFTLDLEGAQKFTAEMNMANEAARRLGTTLQNIQQQRQTIPGLATQVPSLAQWQQGNIPGLPSMSGNVNWRSMGLGALAGIFSPWVGGSMMARSGFFNQGSGKE